MKLTNANFSILRKLDEVGENHDANIVQAKQQISNQNRDLKTAQEKCNAAFSRHASHTHCSTECRDEIQSACKEKCELKKELMQALSSLLTTWTFTWIEKNMTMESQNKDFHWVNHQMVENRVSRPCWILQHQKQICLMFVI